MRYAPVWKQIGITKDRYFELLHFCKQYPGWVLEAGSLLGNRAFRMDGQPRGTGKSDPVAMAAEKRERLLNKIAIVEDCARTAGGQSWYAAIIQNVCIGQGYNKIDATLMPSSHRAKFFEVRRMFFILLDRKTEK